MINWGIGERVEQESFRLMFSAANKNPLVSLLPDTFNIRSNGCVIPKTANKQQNFTINLILFRIRNINEKSRYDITEATK